MMYHLAHQSRDFRLGKIEHASKGFEAEGIVEGGVGEEVGAEAFFLDLAFEHFLDFGVLGEKVPDFDAGDEVGCFLPFAGGEGFGGLHDVISSVFRWAGEDLALMVL